MGRPRDFVSLDFKLVDYLEVPTALGSAGRATRTRTIAISNNGERSRGEGFPDFCDPVVGEGVEMQYTQLFQFPSPASSSQEREEDLTACMIRI